MANPHIFLIARMTSHSYCHFMLHCFKKLHMSILLCWDTIRRNIYLLEANIQFGKLQYFNKQQSRAVVYFDQRLGNVHFECWSKCDRYVNFVAKCELKKAGCHDSFQLRTFPFPCINFLNLILFNMSKLLKIIFWHPSVLCILTSKRLLRMPFAGRNRFSDTKTTFSVTNGTK